MRRLAALAAVTALAVLPAGCGSGQTGTSTEGPDPATVTPAGTPFFVEAVVRPEGDLRDALQSALAKLLVTDDPGGFLAERLNEALSKGNSGITYDQDIKPWLGPRAGFFVESFGSNADGAAIVATTDADATQATIDKAAAADKAKERPRSYHGVDYQVDSKGNAAGIVAGFLVAGTETAFRDVVDASRGQSLADSARFRARRDAADPDRFAFGYVDPAAIVATLTRSGQISEQDLKAAEPQLGAVLDQPVTLTLSATSDQLALETSAAAGPNPATNQSALLAELPGDAWLSFATSDATQVLAGLEAGPAAQSLRSQLGFDLGGELGQWAGDLAAYARGTSIFGLGGALVLETTDEGASGKTLNELQAALGQDPSFQVQPLSGGDPGFTLVPAGTPVQIVFTQRDGKVVVGLGSASVDDVFSPSSKLGDADSFDKAVGSLPDGFAPSVFISFGPLLDLVNSLPDAASDPSYQSAKPYLEALDYLVVGLSSEDGRQAARIALGLTDSSGGSSGSASQAAAVIGG